MSVAGANKPAEGDVSKSNPNLKGPSCDSSPVGVPLSDLRRNSANPRLTSRNKSPSSSSASPTASPSASSVSSVTQGEGLPNGRAPSTDVISDTIPESPAEEEDMIEESVGNVKQDVDKKDDSEGVKDEKPKLASLASTETVDSTLTDDGFDSQEPQPDKQDNKNMQNKDHINSNMQLIPHSDDNRSTHSGVSDTGIHFNSRHPRSLDVSREEFEQVSDTEKDSEPSKTKPDQSDNTNPSNVEADKNVKLEPNSAKEGETSSKQCDSEKGSNHPESSKPKNSTDAKHAQEDKSPESSNVSLPNGRAEVIYLDETKVSKEN